MSFSAFRNPLRAAARRAAQPRFQLRSNFNRKFSTPPPAAEAKSNTALWVGLGAAAVGGAGYYIYTSNDASNAVKSGVQVAKVKANFVPTKEDYIKVRSRRCSRLYVRIWAE